MPIADHTRVEVARRARYRCEYCGDPEAASSTPREIDHMTPEAKGGPPTLENLALCCGACNLHTYVRTAFIDVVSGEMVPLFNPRAQPWPEHFVLNRETGAIQGVAPTGRVTVAALVLNAPHALVTRQLLMRLGRR